MLDHPVSGVAALLLPVPGRLRVGACKRRQCALGLAAVLLAPLVGGTEVTAWRFETDLDGWRPRAVGIRLGHVPEAGAVAGSSGFLHLAGAIDEGWNYALSGSRPMSGGDTYRLSAWLRVHRLGGDAAAPFLKCEFLGAPESGRANTAAYDTRRLGEWQLLTGTFLAPAGTTQCWVAVEKGGQGSMEIEADLDEVLISRIDRAELFAEFMLEPVPSRLATAGRPRLFLDGERVRFLRDARQTTHAKLWPELQAQADAAARRGPPDYRRDDGWSGHEQLWQREVGNTMPVLAMAWLLSGDASYLAAAQAWALASCGYETWGLGRTDGMDLAAGHQLLGLAIVYDWCHGSLDPAARATIRATLERRGWAMFEGAAAGTLWWHRAYLQNHLWVNACGLAAAGLALYGDVEGALPWVGFARDRFGSTMAALGDDGASHEGVGYWQYGAEYLLKFMSLSSTLLGEDLYDHDWWRNTARYALHLSLPRRAWTRSNVIVDLADCPRGHWYGPDHILRALAAAYRDGTAQWLAEETDAANVEAPSARWLNQVWYDPAVMPEPPSRVGTHHHFTDMGIVASRTDWSGDETLLVFKCGPFIGHKAVSAFDQDPGGGHVHPDANHFVLFGHGEWLVRDDGYQAKWTGQHNTLLIDGAGQLGEGALWFQGGIPLARRARPRVIATVTTPELDVLSGDAAPAYSPDLGVSRFVRHLLFLKPDVLLVLDEIAVDRERDLELRFHPEHAAAVVTGNAIVIDGQKTRLRIETLTPQGSTLQAEQVAGQGRNPDRPFSMFTVRLRRRAASWQQVTAMSWAPTGTEPATVTAAASAGAWVFAVGERRLTWDGTAAAWLPRE